jgi:hypothetical protein
MCAKHDGSGWVVARFFTSFQHMVVVRSHETYMEDLQGRKDFDWGSMSHPKIILEPTGFLHEEIHASQTIQRKLSYFMSEVGLLGHVTLSQV